MCGRDWSSDVCSSDLGVEGAGINKALGQNGEAIEVLLGAKLASGE